MNGPVQHRVFANSAIRPATAADIPRGLQIAEEMYPGRGVSAGVEWVRSCVENRNGANFAWIGEHSFIIAHIYRQYGFELRCRIDMLCARRRKTAVLEALQLIKACKRWAALNGVVHPLKLDADTGVDFGPFAKRLGGRGYPVYEIPLDGGWL